jgi:hypothetical protein
MKAGAENGGNGVSVAYRRRRHHQLARENSYRKANQNENNVG